MEDNGSLVSAEVGEENQHWLQFRSVIEQHYATKAKWVTGSSLFYLTLAYSTLIIIGVTGNILVLTAIVRKPEMRTARNVFIANLAVSDLCLCVVTMPLTLIEVVYQRWHWGESYVLCHLHSPIQGVFILISSLSISAIAIDRCIVICVTFIENFTTKTCLALLPFIWVAGCAICSPSGIYKELLSTGESLTKTNFPFEGMVGYYSTFDQRNDSAIYRMEEILNRTSRCNITDRYVTEEGRDVQAEVVTEVDFLIKEMAFPEGDIVEYAECIEVWPSDTLELCYSLLVTIVQFLLPLLVAGIANAAIYCKLKERLETYTTRQNSNKRMQDVLRMKRTCKLLVSMVTVFLICWLPLSLFNLTLPSIRATVTDKNTFFTLFGTCHLLGMTSACTNPVLYGFLNESFKNEFKEMLSHLNVKQKFVVGAQAEAESHPRAESEALLRSQQAAETKNEPPTALK